MRACAGLLRIALRRVSFPVRIGVRTHLRRNVVEALTYFQPVCDVRVDFVDGPHAIVEDGDRLRRLHGGLRSIVKLADGNSHGRMAFCDVSHTSIVGYSVFLRSAMTAMWVGSLLWSMA